MRYPPKGKEIHSVSATRGLSKADFQRLLDSLDATRSPSCLSKIPCRSVGYW